jgi:hypothetical protein
MKKNMFLQFKKTYFSLLLFFWACPCALHLKDHLQSLRRRSYNILNHSKWRRIEKDLSKCSVIGKRSMMS